MGTRRKAAILGAAVALVAATGADAGSSSQALQRKNLVVPLQIVKEGKQVLALVPVTIDGRVFTFALDTGASRSMIDSQVARKLAVPKAGSAGKVAGVNGVKTAAFVMVKSWSIGHVKLPPTVIVSQ